MTSPARGPGDPLAEIGDSTRAQDSTFTPPINVKLGGLPTQAAFCSATPEHRSRATKGRNEGPFKLATTNREEAEAPDTWQAHPRYWNRISRALVKLEAPAPSRYQTWKYQVWPAKAGSGPLERGRAKRFTVVENSPVMPVLPTIST